MSDTVSTMVDTVVTTATVPITSDSTTAQDVVVTVVETTTTTIAPNPVWAFFVSLAFCKCAAPTQTSDVVDKAIAVPAEAAPAVAEVPAATLVATTSTTSSTIVATEATASFEEFVEVTTTTVTTTETIVEEVDAPASVTDLPSSPVSDVAPSTVSDDTAHVKKSEEGGQTGSEAGSTSGTTKDKKARRRMSQTIKDFGGKLRTLGRSKTQTSLEETKEAKEA